MAEEILLLKIGGSALTDKKSSAMTIDYNRLTTVVSQVKSVEAHVKHVMLVTGVGAHGHLPVLQYRIHKGWLNDSNQLVGLVEAQYRVNQLRNALIKTAWDYELPVFQCYASSIIQNNKGKISEAYLDNLKKFLNLGLIPVISGDVVPDATMGFSVCSGDDIIFLLAREFNIKTVYFGMDVNGIFPEAPDASDGRIIDRLTVTKARRLLLELEGEDASGGIRNKLEKSIEALENHVVDKVVFFNLLREKNLKILMARSQNAPHTLLTRD